MTSITGPLLLIWRRARANWRFHLVLFAGILLATTLLAAAPLYLNSVRELGLRHSLEFERTGVLDTAILVPFRPLDESGYERTRTLVTSRADETIGKLVDLRVSLIKTAALNTAAAGPAQGRALPGVKVSVQAYSEYEAHSRVVAGRFPSGDSGQALQAGVPVEVGVGRASAETFGLKIGDTIPIVPVGGNPSRLLSARVVGILEPIDLSERYWGFAVNPFAPQSDQSTGQEVSLLPVLVPPQTFLGQIASSFRGMVVDYWWYLYVDPSRIRSDQLGETSEAIKTLEVKLPGDLPGATVLSGLGGTLDAFDNKLFFSRIPVLVMVVVVTAIVLYYLVMVANVVVDRHLAEIALFRSRGANAGQVMATYLWEAVVLTVAAALLGPLLARLLVPLLGKAPAFSDVTGGSLLPVTLSAKALWFSLLGAGLSLLALAVPALRGARFNVLDVRASTARPALTLFLHKYFIDLFLLALTGVLYWELTQRGSLVTQRLFGGKAVDELLLIAPVLLMVSLALLLLRALPVLLRLLSLLASHTSRVWLAMGLLDLGRNPLHYLRPALLLMLVAAMAMFAASYDETLERSFRDRGLYSAGSDVRLENLPARLMGEGGPVAQLEKDPGVKLAGAAYRSSPQQESPFSNRSVDLLAVDSIKFHRVSFYRSDFSQTDLFTLMRQLDRGRSILRGRDLPRGTTAVGVWVRPAQSRPNISLWVRVHDETGRVWRYRMGRLDFDDWRFLRAPLTDAFGQPLQGQLSLESIYVWELDFPEDPFPLDFIANGHTSAGKINFSRLTAITGPDPRGTVIDSLERPAGWGAMAIRAVLPETLKADNTVTREGRPTLDFSWGTSPGTGTRGFFPSDLDEALPIVASQRFLGVTGRRTGDTVEITVAGITVPVKIADAVDFFPTMDPFRPFVLGNLDTLLHYANLFRGLNSARPNEVWLTLADDSKTRLAFVTNLRTGPLGPYIAGDSAAVVRSLTGDPLVGTGSRGIVFAVLVVLIIVSIGGYLAYFYIASYRRPLEFAVLRALGLSGTDLVAFQLLVHLFVILSAVLLGGWIGTRAHSVMITFLQHTDQGRAVLPPFTPQTDWSGIGVILLACLVSLGAIVVAAGWTFTKTPVWRVLRRGEG